LGRGQLQVVCLAVLWLAAPAQSIRFESPRNASFVVPGVPATISILVEPDVEDGSWDQLVLCATITTMHTPSIMHIFPVLKTGKVLVTINPIWEDLAIEVDATLMRQSFYDGLIAGLDGETLLWCDLLHRLLFPPRGS